MDQFILEEIDMEYFENLEERFVKCNQHLKRTLKMPLKKKWFDMILSGEKTEEYREFKEYWWKRIVNSYITQETVSKWTKEQKNLKGLNGWVEFTNGYGNHCPKMIVEINGIFLKSDKTEWGAENNKIYITLDLGKVVHYSNLKDLLV